MLPEVLHSVIGDKNTTQASLNNIDYVEMGLSMDSKIINRLCLLCSSFCGLHVGLATDSSKLTLFS